MTEVKIYTTPICPKCQKTKEFLDNEGIEYEEVDVAKNTDKAKEMYEKSGQKMVPVLEIGGEIITGFDKDKIKEALEK